MLLLLVALVSFASAGCPDVQTFVPFNATKYLGTWYEIALSPLIKNTFEHDCYCTHAVYGVDTAKKGLSVHNVCNKGSVTGPVQSIEGYAVQAGPTGEDASKLKVYFNGHGGNYWVVHVDERADGLYDNAVVWSCEHLLINLEWAWILSREPTMDSPTYQRLLGVLHNATGYDAAAKMTVTNQSCSSKAKAQLKMQK